MEQVLERWPLSLTIPVLWGDMDAFGHVNNIRYLRWFESGRIQYFEKINLLESMKKQGVGPILAHTSIDFLHPIVYPDTIQVQTTISHMGNTSFTMKYRVLSLSLQKKEAARGEGIIVMINYREGKKVVLSDSFRESVYALEKTAN